MQGPIRLPENFDPEFHGHSISQDLSRALGDKPVHYTPYEPDESNLTPQRYIIFYSESEDPQQHNEIVLILFQSQADQQPNSNMWHFYANLPEDEWPKFLDRLRQEPSRTPPSSRYETIR
jgi:hypothetical protein